MTKQAIERHQMWRRKLDQKAVVVTCTEGNVISFYEHRNPRVVGCRGIRQWREQFYLMGIDDVTCETGGIF